MCIKQWMAITLFLFISPFLSVYASEEVDQDVQEEVSFWDEFFWDATVGAGIDFNQEILNTQDNNQFGAFIDINFSIEYKRFYLEVQRSTLPGGSIIGYHLWQGEQWQVDIIGANYALGFDEHGTYLPLQGDDYEPTLEGIHTRKDDFNIGLKLSYQFNSFLWNSEWVHDVSSSHESWMVRNIAIKSFSGGNWDLLGGIGFDIYSAKMANYYYGVAEDEVSDLRSAYKPGLSSSIFTQFVAEYPISESWVFHSAASIGAVSKTLQKSPIVSTSPRVVVYTGVRYVF